jgi:hypothetical protein
MAKNIYEGKASSDGEIAMERGTEFFQVGA